MPDNVPITAGVGTDIATDQLLTGEHVQLLKLVDGTANSSTRIEAGGGAEANAIRVTIANNSTGLVSVDDNGATLSVDDNGGSLTVDGTVTVTDGGGSLTVDGAVTVSDGGGTISVDGTVTANLAAGTNNIGDVDVLTVPAPLNVVGGGTEAAALRVTIANNSTGVVSVDDNGGSLTVDGSVTVADGGGSLTVDGSVTVTDGGGSLTVDGTVTANLAAGTNNIGDVDVLTVPAPLNVTGGGVELGALRVTLANDSTGVLSVDDGGGVLTVDGTVTASDGGGSLTVDNGGTFAVQESGAALTALQLIDNCIAGSEAQVDIVASLPAGNNNIGDVDIATVPAPLSTTGGGVEANALRVTIANNSTGLVSVDDNGSSLSVDDNGGSLSIDDGGGTITVDGTVTVTDGGGTITVDGTVAVTDGGGSLTVDGTVTANLSAVDNAVLDDIASNQTDGTQKTQVIDGAGNVVGSTGNALDVNIKSGSSSGTQYTEGDVDATVTGTAAMWKDAGNTLRTVTSGNPLPVNVVAGGGTGGTAVADDSAFTPTTTLATPVMGAYESVPTSVTDNELGVVGITVNRRLKTSATVDAALPAGTNNIGDVDVLSVPAPLNLTGGGAEASALRVTIANDSTGLVSVDDNGSSLSVDDNGSTLSVDDGGGALTVDGTVTANLAAGTNNIGDVDVLTVPAPLSTTGGGTEAAALRVTIANDSTGVLSVDDNGGALTVDGTVTANLAAGTNNIGDVDVLSVPAPLNLTGGGAEASALRVTIANDSTGVLSVDDNGGALTVDGTVTAVGAAAHDDAVSGNPVQLAGEARSSERSAVANADVARLVTDLAGKLIALPYANPENFVRGATSDITDTTDTQVIAAGGAGVKLYITQILVTNGDADTGTFVNIKDGSGGTTLYTGYAASGGGGFSVTLPVPIVTTANTGLYAGCATTGATVRVSASGYKGA